MTAKKSTSTSRKAPSRAATTKTARAKTGAATTRSRSKSAAASAAGKSKSRRKTDKSESTFAAIGEWMHEAGLKMKKTRKRVMQKAKTKIRRLLHLRPQTA